MTDTPLREMFGLIDRGHDAFMERLLEVATIPAPTFGEAARAAWVHNQFEAAGLGDVHIDDSGNVVGSCGGSGPVLVVAAHMDTVFAASEDHSVRRQDGRLYGRGIGDNSLGLAALTAVAELTADLDLAGKVLFAATTGEEGLGNLRGVRGLFAGGADETMAFIAVEGHFLGQVVNTAVGSRRFRISASGPGGHSWHDYGRPSAVAAIAEIAHTLSTMDLPKDARSTLNIGRIEGGEGVNVIARAANCDLDLRSSSQRALDAMEFDMGKVIERAQRDGLAFEVETIGDRPAAVVSPREPLVESAIATLEALGMNWRLVAASTDANLPASLGIPAVSVGISRGSGMHSSDEWVEEDLIPSGLKHLVSLTVAMARMRG